MSKINKNLPIIFIVILATTLLFYKIDKPLVGHHDFTGAFEGTIAKNYLKYGIINLKMGQVSSQLHVDVGQNHSFYTHYLPLVPLMIALSFSIFGISEWAVRLVPIIFSLFGLIFLFKITEQLWNRKIAFFACLFYILNPMFIYFAKLPVPEPLVLSFGLGSIYFYLNWFEERKNRYFWSSQAMFLLGGLAGWPIIYLAPLYIFHSLILKKFSPKILFFSLNASLIVALQLLHAKILTGSFFGGGIISTALFRLADSRLSFGGQDFSFGGYFRQEISWLQAYFTRIQIFFAGIFILFNIRPKINLQIATILLLLFFGISHPILFSRYVFIHDFLNIYLLPFFAVSAALGLNLTCNLLTKIGIKSYINYLLISVIFIAVFLERLSFTKALLNSQMNKPGLEMSNILNSLDYQTDKAAIISPRFDSFYGVFTQYYSKIPYKIMTEMDLATGSVKGIKYIIMIDEDIHDQNLYNKLKSEHSYSKNGVYTIFNLNESI